MYGKKLYKEYYAQVNSGVHFQPEFHECTPVSMVALRYMFAICAALLSLAGLITLIECKERAVVFARRIKFCVYGNISKSIFRFWKNNYQ